MRAYHLTAPGLEHLVRTEAEPPRPGPGEVLVRLRAASLNYIDLAVATGGFPVPHLPLIPVTDGAGEVIELGAGVEGVRPGERVVPHFLPAWTAGAPGPVEGRRMRGITMPGSLAELAVVPAGGLVRMPEHLSFEEAASLPIAATTAWKAMRTAAVRPGSRVLLLGTGGVSLFALQFAKAAGARVILTSSSDEKLERARALGADETINYRSTPDWDAEVLKRTDGAGVDLVVETVGAQTFGRSLNAAAVEGTVFVVGFVTGGELATSLFPVILKTLRVIGSNTGSVADLAEAAEAIAATRIRPVLDRVFSFDEAPAAYGLMQRGGHFGKLAITV
ncbi:zinc-dependent alcohol dehydrogenase family protein [Labrys wisconsinensis]|uniref:NADPH:quinone reductase-like Zn-dependent oxidoreductase n=1 Tax=Labrys wisconsinensis TaxID=425677 RepID=A0ABU0JKF9_9HYPH|nr:NAD(P)-dependent alcohol dehydrogenase [Labrys wisconsinensis]MDQ0474075.1 NADPH:quinone reductase-like Zn-dependent oxidoreductase [Labrys wisconsinensis]